MLGHRGVRLGISYPEITEMQVKQSSKQLLNYKRGVKAFPEIMVPCNL